MSAGVRPISLRVVASFRGGVSIPATRAPEGTTVMVVVDGNVVLVVVVVLGAVVVVVAPGTVVVIVERLLVVVDVKREEMVIQTAPVNTMSPARITELLTTADLMQVTTTQ